MESDLLSNGTMESCLKSSCSNRNLQFAEDRYNVSDFKKCQNNQTECNTMKPVYSLYHVGEE
jgi:hypothetical protein